MSTDADLTFIMEFLDERQHLTKYIHLSNQLKHLIKKKLKN